MDKPDKLEVLSSELQNTIQQCLRKGDSFTKYSPITVSDTSRWYE